MKALVHIEPVWFRNDVNLLVGHFDILVRPILSALSQTDQKFELGISSNIVLAIGGIDLARQLPSKDVDLKIFGSSVGDLLKDVGFSRSAYSRDIYSVNNSEFPNKYLKSRLTDIMEEFSPEIVITTSKNRYLEAICGDLSVPLICSELGPLPRSGFHGGRHISIGSHISRDFGDILSGQGDDDALDIILAAQDQAIAASTTSQAVADFVNTAKAGGTIAVLALQPDDWVTWEGSVDNDLSPSEVVFLALERLQSDRLIVLFHPLPSGKIDPGVLTEIWLSDPRIVRAPGSLDTGLTEEFIPHVDEVLTVSSNIGVLAFLYDKTLQTLGQSFLNFLPTLPKDQASRNEMRRSVASALYSNLHIESDTFEDRVALRQVILKRLQKSGHAKTVSSLIRAEKTVPPVRRTLTENLEQIHQLIQENLDELDEASLLNMFGRNAIGYLLPKDSVGAELGVAGGYFSESLLMTDRFKTLYSVDMWGDHHDEAEYQHVCSKLARFGENSQILRNSFDEALDLIPDGSLDFLYVDGYAHTGENAGILLKWLPKMSEDAIVSGHDFCKQAWPLNYAAIKNAAIDNKIENLKIIPGVVTGNSEDVFPSFVATPVDQASTKKPSRSIRSYFSKRKN